MANLNLRNLDPTQTSPTSLNRGRRSRPPSRWWKNLSSAPSSNSLPLSQILQVVQLRNVLFVSTTSGTSLRPENLGNFHLELRFGGTFVLRPNSILVFYFWSTTGTYKRGRGGEGVSVSFDEKGGEPIDESFGLFRFLYLGNFYSVQNSGPFEDGHPKRITPSYKVTTLRILLLLIPCVSTATSLGQRVRTVFLYQASSQRV